MIADDSGLRSTHLQGAPGVRSARYAADEHNAPEDSGNSDDEANNARLLRELHDVPEEFRTGRFVCMIAVARNGHTLATFHGKAEGIILHAPRGQTASATIRCSSFPQIEKTFAELTAQEKAKYSHRGAAFSQFLDWADHLGESASSQRSVTFVTMRWPALLRYAERAFEIARSPQCRASANLRACSKASSFSFLTYSVYEIDNARFAFIIPRILFV